MKAKRGVNRTERMSPMAKRLVTALNGDWIRASALVGFAGNGKRMKRESLRRMVLRAVDEFCELGTAERKTEPNPLGGTLTFVRRNAAKLGISQQRDTRSTVK
jgi:hypothetical protein